MKVTAFYLISKVEEAASSYFSNSMIFSSQKVITERYTNFRRHTAGVSFSLERREENDNISIGSFSVETIQEKEDKIAFQCKINILPSGENEQFFILLPIDRDSYGEYMEFIEKMKKYWEKKADKYLPNEGDLPLTENVSSSIGNFAPEDEYEGLTPEEIEAVTGVRPGSEPSSTEDEMSAQDILSQFAASENEEINSDPVIEDSQELDENDIASLLSAGIDSTDNEEKQELDENDINALLGTTDPESEVQSDTNETKENFEAELSEDDISALLGSDPGDSTEDDTASDDPQNMSMDDISSLLGAQTSDDDTHITHEEDSETKEESAEMSVDDIDSLMADISEPENNEETPSKAEPAPEEEKAQPNNDEPAEMSAEDIWKQISGG